MKKILLSLLALPLLASAADIYMIGDSTMAKYLDKFHPLAGWGMSMQKHCRRGVTVHNLARSGRSTISYYIRTNLWQTKIMPNLKPGDFVIIQFGHNDARQHKGIGYAPHDTVYQEYLKKYVDETRSKGAIPVICSQTIRCDFDKKSGKPFNRKPNDLYVAAAKKSAADNKCDFIDLNAFALKHFEQIGKMEAEKLYMCFAKGIYANYPDGKGDRCHLSFRGADFYAQAFVTLAKKQNLAIARLFK